MSRNAPRGNTVEQAAAAEPQPVTLVNGDGHEITTADPTVVNSLVYGQGYAPVKGTAAEAVAQVTPPPEQSAG